MEMYHIFFIHSAVEGHVGCIPLLAIINKAALNIVKHVSLLYVGAFLGICQEEKYPAWIQNSSAGERW